MCEASRTPMGDGGSEVTDNESSGAGSVTTTDDTGTNTATTVVSNLISIMFLILLAY